MCTPLRHSIFLAVNVDRARDLQIFSMTVSPLSYAHNMLLSDLILDFLISISYHVWPLKKLNLIVNIMHPLNIVSWCPFVGSRSRTIISYYSWDMDLNFTLVHQLHFEHVTYESPYLYSNKFQFRFYSMFELTVKQIHVLSYLHLFSTWV